jgi:predicted methyltransferase
MTSSRSPRPAVSRRVVFAGALLLFVAIASGLPGLRAAPDDAAQARQLFELLELKPGMTVAEIGGGSGGMTMEMAQRLGPEGRIYSAELNPDRRAEIRAAATKAELSNVTVIESGDRTPNLPAGCCDAIFMRSVYHHFTHPEEMDRSLVAALKPGGRLAVIDFEPTAGSKVADGVPANRVGHGVPPPVVIAELATAGLTSSGSSSVWPNEQVSSDNRMFIILFRKPAS